MSPIIADAEPTSDEAIAARRGAIDAKQARLAALFSAQNCEGAVLLSPHNVAWFVGGWHVRGLLADTERPGVYTNGKQRWLVCSNIDAQRLFDEELDRLGFQLKEWHWTVGRAALLGELLAGKRVASDRPFPNTPLIHEPLRGEIRALAAPDRLRYRQLGLLAAHALEATARMMEGGETEQELAGQVAHRLYRGGAEVAAVSVQALPGPNSPPGYGRLGFGLGVVEGGCRLQVTATRLGLYATASRTVSLGPPGASFTADHDAACRLSAAYRAHARPGQTFGNAGAASRKLFHDTAYEYDWRRTQPGYGTGWLAAEEPRRQGADEKFVAGQPLVWQAHLGGAAVVDTLIADDEPEPVTPPENWPFKRIVLNGQRHDVPDVLVR